MFTRWGELVYKLRYTVLGVAVAALLGLGAYGFGLENHLSSSGWFDPGAESSEAAVIKDQVYGRDHMSDVIALYTAPEGKTIDDPEFGRKITESLNSLPKKYPDQITRINLAYWPTETGDWSASTTGSKDKKHAFATIAIKGDNDTEMVNNFRKVKDVFSIPGVEVQVAGMQPVSGTLNDTIASDQKRMEMLAIPAVGILLFFIFGGVVAAALPLIVGGLTVLGANGIVMGVTHFTEVNSFVGAVVSMIGLGLAIDYGLFIVSRFREELAEGYTTRQAVRRAVQTAGRTVVFSATMIIAASAGMLIFPQGFLKSVAYGTIATVLLAALASLTVLPAMLAILGPRVDALGFKRFRKTKTAEEVENGFWGRTTQWVMKHPLKVAVPLCIVLLLLIIPVKNLQFGGISETYLPPDNPTRVAQETFDEIFPLRQTDPVQLVIITNHTSAINGLLDEASKAPGLEKEFGSPGIPPNNANVWVSETTLTPDADIEDTLGYLRSIPVPDDVELLVGGQPVLMQDSIDSLMDRMPLMIFLVVLVTTLLMFLTFGSLVLPIKAALMSALGLGSTLGILTWIFIDGHGAGLLNFTPQPIMSPVLVLIMAIIYGLSTDYEVFLLSRMVEARSQGASTTEAVRTGTAQTGRIITAAALILLVVVGAFAFSDLVMMQYIAYGMMAALFIDATVLRMLLVPATMKLLGDDCWWAPAWMKRIQQRIGLSEPTLDDERPGNGEVVDLVKTTPVTDPVTMQLPQLPDNGKSARKPRRLRFMRADPEAPTTELRRIDPDAGAPGRAVSPGASGGTTPETGAAAGATGTAASDASAAGTAGAPAAGPTAAGAAAAAGAAGAAAVGAAAVRRANQSPDAEQDPAANTSDAATSSDSDSGEEAKPSKRKVFAFRRPRTVSDAPKADPGSAQPGSTPDNPSDSTPGGGSADPSASSAPPSTSATPSASGAAPQTPGTRSDRVLPPPATRRPEDSGAASGVIGAPGPVDPARDAPEAFGGAGSSGVIGAPGPHTGTGPNEVPPHPGVVGRPESKGRPDTTGTQESTGGSGVPGSPQGGGRPEATGPGRPSAPSDASRPPAPPSDGAVGTFDAFGNAPGAPEAAGPSAPSAPSGARSIANPQPPQRPSAPPTVSMPNAGTPPEQERVRPPQVVRPGMPPRTVPAPDPADPTPPTAPVGTTPRMLPPQPSNPPQPPKLPPHPSVRAQLYRPDAPPYHPGEPAAGEPGRPQGPQPDAPPQGGAMRAESAPPPAAEPPRRVPRPAPAAEQPTQANEPVVDSTAVTPPQGVEDVAQTPAEGPVDNRDNIEEWMANLRSSRRRPDGDTADEDPKNRNSGRTVSVNELLRRQNKD
ncbi:MMPL family transporter [Nocardia vermiculata]|uniref:MMPL family transporter n=1 Tax=Nocardia vermiculata TaxID=257274 RepID=A0A846Y2B9_9NOCA|nr:MMPL family transporter [Nocardia vermiculata]NKY53646.1 MMPL family transporter [Nocardia vermiculata]